MMGSPETRLFHGYWEDGALDFVGGTAVVLIGLTYVFEQLFLVGAILPLGLVAWWGIRRLVVEPRAGYVRFSRRRRERSERELVGTIGIGAGLLALVVFGALHRAGGGGAADLVVGLPAVLLALGSALVGGLTRTWRFGVYAALSVIAAAVTVVLGMDPGWPIVVVGLVTSASGAALLGRFTAASRRYEQAKG